MLFSSSPDAISDRVCARGKLVENVFVFNTLRGNQHHLTPEDATIGAIFTFTGPFLLMDVAYSCCYCWTVFPFSPHWGLYYLPYYCENYEIVRMCEWTSTSGQVTKRALRVSGRNRKSPLAVFRRIWTPLYIRYTIPQLLKGNFLEPSHLLLSPPKRQVLYRQELLRLHPFTTALFWSRPPIRERSKSFQKVFTVRACAGGWRSVVPPLSGNEIRGFESAAEAQNHCHLPPN